MRGFEAIKTANPWVLISFCQANDGAKSEQNCKRYKIRRSEVTDLHLVQVKAIASLKQQIMISDTSPDGKVEVLPPLPNCAIDPARPKGKKG